MMGKIRKNRRRSDLRTRNVGAVRSQTRRKPKSKKIFVASTYTCPKLGETESDNSDSYCVNLENYAIAVADGASRSYNPRTWSKALTLNFTQKNLPLTIANIENIANSQGTIAPETLSWNEEELMLNGSHSTLLIIYSMQKRKNSITFSAHSIGDSILVICDKGGYISSAYPHVSIDKFPTTPSLAANIAPYFRGKPESPATLEISVGETLYLMTDAIARFVARNKTMHINELFPFLGQKDKKHFLDWAARKRESLEIEDDDLTLVEVKF